MFDFYCRKAATGFDSSYPVASSRAIEKTITTVRYIIEA
ncbi:hypothetical protein CKA32_004437 [Geitlerinema sp. FC II]|nr:hypothetical protein CKA32_004437 [Geitlerinema sp. FC II]